MTSKNKTAIILPRGFDLNKSYALQRLMDDPQHKAAVDYIINDLSATYHDPTDENPYYTYRSIGRASVGRDMVTIYKMNLAKIKDMLAKEKSK